MQQCDEAMLEGLQHKSEGKVGMLQEYKGLESYMFIVETELEMVQMTSHCNVLLNYANQNKYEVEIKMAIEEHYWMEKESLRQCNKLVEKSNNLSNKVNFYVKKARKITCYVRSFKVNTMRLQIRTKR